jgi:hypothetical protein
MSELFARTDGVGEIAKLLAFVCNHKKEFFHFQQKIFL